LLRESEAIYRDFLKATKDVHSETLVLRARQLEAERLEAQRRHYQQTSEAWRVEETRYQQRRR